MSRILPILLFSIAAVANAGEFPKVGSRAPKIELKSNEMKKVSLADFKGKWVVLYFYPKNFTGGCTLQARNFQRDVKQYEKRNAVILGVSVDSAESHKEFCTKEGLSFRTLSDPDAKVSRAYNSLLDYKGQTMSARNTFIIDPAGRLAQVFPGVKPAGHSAEVLAALDKLSKK